MGRAEKREGRCVGKGEGREGKEDEEDLTFLPLGVSACVHCPGKAPLRSVGSFCKSFRVSRPLDRRLKGI